MKKLRIAATSLFLSTLFLGHAQTKTINSQTATADAFSNYYNLPQDLSKINISQKDFFVNAHSVKVRQSVGILQDIAKELKEIYSNVHDFTNYVFLSNIGIDKKIISHMDSFQLEEIVQGIENKQFPLELLLEEESMLTYPLKSAIYSTSFTNKKEVLQEYIKTYLDSKMTSYKSQANYSESSEQVHHIEDEIILTNLKRYIDYFANEKNWTQIDKLFEKTTDSLRLERGGMIIDRNGSIELLEIKNLTNKLDTYYNGAIRHFAPRLGDFHTHTDDGVTDITILTGPSGRVGETKGDLRVLEIFQEINPYIQNVVISEMGAHMYNVDTYFIESKYVGDYLEKVVTVLDLGVYYVGE